VCCLEFQQVQKNVKNIGMMYEKVEKFVIYMVVTKGCYDKRRISETCNGVV